MRRALHRKIPSQISLWIIVVVFAVLLLWLLLHARAVTEWWFDVQENSAYATHPSAELALEDGDNHFDSVGHPEEYDIVRAQYFLHLAAQQDPNLPTVFHQLARIAFLEDNFPVALAYSNIQIERQGDTIPNSYYIRGLIEGYMGDYADAEKDYARFLQLEPHNDTYWAGLNDYAWVLLKDNKAKKAAEVTSAGLISYPNNPWLLNINATALYEIGDTKDAKAIIERASVAVATLTATEWSGAYPGNSPDIAAEGVATFQKAVADNMHTILVATTSRAI